MQEFFSLFIIHYSFRPEAFLSLVILNQDAEMLLFFVILRFEAPGN